MKKIILLLVAVAALMYPVQGSASIDSTFWSGSTTVASDGIIYGGNWSTAILSWNVSANSDGSWHYSYTFTESGSNIGNFLLGVTNPFPASDFYNLTGTPPISISSDDPKTYKALKNPNTHMPNDLYGFKLIHSGSTGFGTNSITFSFDTSHSPTWGDFYSQDGQDNYAYNAGFSGAYGDELSPTNHIVVPDGVVSLSPVPVAPAVWLLGSGLLGLVVIRRRFRK